MPEMTLPAVSSVSGSTSQGVEVPDYPLSVETIANTLSSDTDAGYKITRRKYTKVLHRWTLKWSMLPGSHYSVIDTFFTNVGGAAGIWQWTHPLTGTFYDVRFKDDTLKFDLIIPGPESEEDAGDGGYYSGSIVLEEV